MSKYRLWLARLKPGDKVARRKPSLYQPNGLSVAIVARLTKTQIIMADATRYRLINGEAIPYCPNDYLRKITPDVRAQIDCDGDIKSLNAILINKPRATDYTPEQRRAILAIMEGNEDE